jgi:hypothetical protein
MHELETGNFDIYLEKYSRDRGITKEEALKHKLVQDVKVSYEAAERDKTKDAK